MAKRNDNNQNKLKEIWDRINVLESRIEQKSTDSEREAANASKMASEYRNRIKDSKELADELLKDIKDNYATQKSFLEEYQNLLSHHADLESEYKLKLTSLESEIQILSNKKLTLTNLIDELESYFENNPDIGNQIKELDSLIEKGNDESAKINLILKNASNRKNEIDELYYEILGSEETDEESGKSRKIEGLKDQLTASFNEFSNELEEFQSTLDSLRESSVESYEKISTNWNKRYKQLEKEITDLLPNALTAGLSSAYSKKKEDEELDLDTHTKNFRWSIGFLVIASLIPFAVGIYLIIDQRPLLEVVKEIPRVVLSILPLYIPLLWLAYSTSKKVNLSKRLIEEYTHKEVLSRTFEGLSKQINGIEDSSISYELRIKLLYNLLHVSSENPGKLIYDYNNSDHPIIDAIDKSSKLSSAVDRLEKIPGFKKIAKILEKRADKILDEQTQKVEVALTAMTEDSEESEKINTEEA